MAIKRYNANADNTINNAFDTLLAKRGTGSNAGANDVLETFSIYGQHTTSSSELSRILIKFPITGTTSIKADRDASLIPASGSAKFYLRLFNARHSEQIPENFTLSILPIARNWEEGTGIDLVNHSDETKDVIPGSNWVNRTKGVAWARNGGDYISGSQNSAVVYTASFVTGSEDLEVDVTSLIEEWISTSTTAATATITFTDKPNEDTTITLIDSDATSVTFVIDDSAPASTVSGTKVTEIAENGGGSAGTAIDLAAKINASALKIAASIPQAGRVLLTQETAGRVGNTTITYSDATSWGNVTSGDLPTTFTSGEGVTNYGFGVMITSSQEAYFSNSAGDSGSELQNTAGQQQSVYTKRFYSRSSEYFFKKPVIEVRWDDRITDDRNKFFASSSLCTTQNTQSVYLYNYIDGQLTSLGTTVQCKIFASSGSVPTGNALTTDTSASMVSTGVYRADVVVDTTASVLHDVWQRFDGEITYHTGTISVRTRSANDSNQFYQYVNKITNLRDVYSNKETARFRVFARQRNFEPTLYTVANSVIEGETIVSASYSIVRLADEEVIFSHSTGSSDRETFLSYDNSGSYFDFDMSMLRTGYMYGVKLAYYVAGGWREQEEVFKFRVES